MPKAVATATIRPAASAASPRLLDEPGRQQSGECQEDQGEAEKGDRERRGGPQRSDRHESPVLLRSTRSGEWR